MRKQVIVLVGQVPSQKNSKKMTFIGEKPVLYTSAIVRQWQEEASWQLKRKEKFLNQVRVQYKFFIKDKRRRDLDNMVSTVNDALVKSGIIRDDDWQSLVIGGAIGVLDRNNPRVVITIEEVR